MISRHFTLTEPHDRIVCERAEQLRGNKSAAVRSLIDGAQGKSFRLRHALRSPLKEITAQCIELRRQRPTPVMLAAIERIEQAALQAEELVLNAG
jgi:hypothetical protein